MGLAIRIVPQLLCRGRQLFKGKQFNSWRSVGLASQAVRIHQMRGVDELVLLDIAATPEGRGPDLNLVRELAEVCFSPLSVGGGVRTIEDVRSLIHNGADKVVIGTAAVEDPEFIARAADGFGSSTIVVALDVKDGKVCIRCGKETRAIDPVEQAIAIESMGAGEIILTSVDREGTLDGYDLELINKVSQAVNIPVVAAGGCGTYEHMKLAIDAGASAVSAGAMFQFTDATPRGAAEYLHSQRVEVRL